MSRLVFNAGQRSTRTGELSQHLGEFRSTPTCRTSRSSPILPQRLCSECSARLESAEVTHGRATRAPGSLVLIQSDSSIFADVDKAAPDESEAALTDWLGSRIVIWDGGQFHKTWSFLLVLMLVYVATVLPFKLAFLDFRIPDELPESLSWKITSWVVDTFFWFDLIVNFLLSFNDKHGREVTSIRRIAIRYLTGAFSIDFISCMPAEVFEVIFKLFTSQSAGDNGANKSLRIMRLNRLPKLAKVIRVLRLSKLFRFVRDSSLWRKLMRLRGFREFNFVLGFITVAHLLACGWYLVGSLHGADQVQKTWIYRRDQSVSMLAESPAEQWLHSLYFIITVFTTVGFGDMSAFTCAEMVYVILAMIIGTLVNSVIMGQIIQIMQTRDHLAISRQEQATLMENFAEHTQINRSLTNQFLNFVKGTESIHWGYNREQVKMLMSHGVFPRELENELPHAFFNGELIQNRMLRPLKSTNTMPLRLPLYVALALHQRFMVNSDIAYCVGDEPSSIHLVLTGVFAGVTMRRGEAPDKDHSSSLLTSEKGKKPVQKECKPGEFYPYQLFCRRSYFGDTEVLFSHSARRTSMRCEADGAMLVFERHDLMELTTEFPHHIRLLRKTALGRERGTCRAMKSNKHYLASYLDVAAVLIQKQWRRLENEGLRAGRSKPVHETIAAGNVLALLESHVHVSVGPIDSSPEAYGPSSAPRTARRTPSSNQPQVDRMQQQMVQLQDQQLQLMHQIANLTKIVSEGFEQNAQLHGRDDSERMSTTANYLPLQRLLPATQLQQSVLVESESVALQGPRCGDMAPCVSRAAL